MFYTYMKDFNCKPYDVACERRHDNEKYLNTVNQQKSGAFMGTTETINVFRAQKVV